ncbi:MAG: hypothetical protein WC866_01625 [Patescibacteria group bacterium]
MPGPLEWGFIFAALSVVLALITWKLTQYHRNRIINAHLAQRGVFYFTKMKKGEKIWCRMERRHVYEIEFLGLQNHYRIYSLKKLVMNENGEQHVEKIYEQVTFRHAELEIAHRFCCNEPGPWSTTIVEISRARLRPEYRQETASQHTHTMYPSEQA